MNSIPKPEFPRPERQRARWLNLNGEWGFRLFPAGSETAEKGFAAHRADYDRAIQVPFSWTCPLSGVQENAAGVGWYRREVSFDRHGRLFLCFGGVDYLADVYVNGVHAGRHQGAYTCFELEVTSLWREDTNIIEVRAEDYRRETQLYGKQGYGDIQGIWQTVWLEDRAPAYIANHRITARISGEVTFSIEADAPDGAVASACFDGQTVRGTVSDGRAELTLRLERPRLWSPDDPQLYEGVLTLESDGRTDEVSTYFGVREISTAKVDGRGYRWILLNGKPIYLNGTLDQAFNPKGHFTYPSDEDMYQEAWRLKRLGLNMVRIHIKPEEPRKLYWMDRLGILVIEDVSCFWGNPDETARAAYENEMPDILARDYNHPSIFSWVLFNETWGLWTREGDSREYRRETMDWVRRMYVWAKKLDPTRIIEDNSACNYDHLDTDLNSWHFYLNGYEVVRDHIREVVQKTFPGSSFNCAEGFVQSDAPLMNSECGMVWGVENSAGDSDLAWQYHYMLNEFRLHEKLCGFVFTEFHDVVNEFNGYYRIDDTDKDFGYQDFCRGMTLRDLHTADFVATDCAPMRTAAPGERMTVPLALSSFTDARHGTRCTLAWELWHDGLDGRVSDGAGEVSLPEFGYGVTKLDDLTVTMPAENAVAVLSLYMKDDSGAVVTRNFTTFDVRAALPENMIEVPVCQGAASGFAPVWTALMDDKLCLGGSGEVAYEIALPERAALNDLTIHLEAGSKRVLKKDCEKTGGPAPDSDFMRGYLVDRGAFENSYWMTDETRFPSSVEVLVDGVPVGTMALENDWADCRGALSWHRQPDHRRLDEAGSYGEQKHIRVPSRLLPAIHREGKFTLTLRVANGGGLALYGRSCGRYPHGLLIELR